MNDYIDIYCERTTPGLWAEPLNALTNLSFFIAAFFAWRYARRRNHLDIRIWLLIILTGLIGLGSTLFHTFATGLTQLSDVIPILLYQIVFIWMYVLYGMKCPATHTCAALGTFLLLTIVSESAPSHILNGSLAYVPAITFLFGFGLWHAKTRQPEAYTLLSAALIFMLSLVFRSIDMAVCDTLRIGTHFLWHVLNGCVLYLTTRGFIAVTAKKGF